MLLFCLPIMTKPPAAGIRYEISLNNWLYIEEQKMYNAYFARLAFVESTNTWDTINQIGAMGKYQFLATTLSDLGIYVTPAQFALNPALFGPEKQDSVIRVFTSRNEAQLIKVINTHPEVNKFAILAASHLAGVQGVRNYFAQGTDAGDGNGTKISKYLKMFN